jgi:hypothetical protein
MIEHSLKSRCAQRPLCGSCPFSGIAVEAKQPQGRWHARHRGVAVKNRKGSDGRSSTPGLQVLMDSHYGRR